MSKEIQPDAETLQFMADLEQSLKEAKAGTYARVHTPEQIMARRGRPVGSTKADAKQQATIRFDRDVLAALRATGRGWQVRLNEMARREVFGRHRQAVAA
jgi:uncharacterized protein (DUF4415 family)